MFRFPASWTRVTSLTVLLVPVSWLFRAAVALRRAFYQTGILRGKRLAVPVIVVGNISVGGNGKTPLVIWLVALLRDAGYHPGVISRGYGASSSTAREVKPDDDPVVSGDEPVLLARRAACPVWTGADRVAAARALLAAHPECNIIVSDDGLQHYALARDVEIAVIDAARGLGNGLLLPAGPLREPRARLDTVDAVVINGSGEAQIVPSAPCFAMRLAPNHFYNLLNPELKTRPLRFAGRRVHAVAGIGNPQRFFATLRELGLEFTAHAFPDHYAYAGNDLIFADCDAIVMTEKDAVKCERFGSDKHWTLRVEAEVDPALSTLILSKLRKKP